MIEHLERPTSLIASGQTLATDDEVGLLRLPMRDLDHRPRCGLSVFVLDGIARPITETLGHHLHDRLVIVEPAAATTIDPAP